MNLTDNHSVSAWSFKWPSLSQSVFPLWYCLLLVVSLYVNQKFILLKLLPIDHCSLFYERPKFHFVWLFFWQRHLGCGYNFSISFSQSSTFLFASPNSSFYSSSPSWCQYPSYNMEPEFRSIFDVLRSTQRCRSQGPIGQNYISKSYPFYSPRYWHGISSWPHSPCLYHMVHNPFKIPWEWVRELKFY